MMKHKIIRVHRRHSAFVYSILESLEGMTSYTTLDYPKAAEYRDLELCIANDFAEEVEAVIEGMRKKFPIVELSNTLKEDGTKC